MERVSKHFGRTRALHDVTLYVAPGEVVGLAGANGSGKSTLLKLLTGDLRPDEGCVMVDGEAVTLRSPADAISLGIALVAQEVPLAPDLSVVENVMMGRAQQKYGFVRWKRMRAAAEGPLGAVGYRGPANAPLQTLDANERQMVAVAQALTKGARLVALDEPTSSLSNDEVGVVMEMISRLAAAGVAVILISHRASELYASASRIAVLRDGELVHDGPAAELDETDLTHLITGSADDERSPHVPTERGESRLTVKGVSSSVLRTVNLEMSAGTIVGITGLVGSGRSELLAACFGLHAITSGRVLLNQTEVGMRRPRSALSMGAIYVPPDRKLSGVLLDQSVARNIALTAHTSLFGTRMSTPRSESRLASELCSQFRISCPSVATPVRSLSGGNQQKVLLARAAAVGPTVWLLDEPTRGVDIGAKQDIHRALRSAAISGALVVVATAETTDLVELCDRVIVMSAGAVVADLTGDDCNESTITRNALGAQT